ncbi:protein phosphatase 2C domain-containing protein [Streptomyces sp. NRRL WC-3742]|uniref:protein phosphatase 2C domain-containing protein n=1 Tax=Streptomyces sp. NRRL WC-3742 TaxID=1463934 RepID=UPI0004C60BCF|nr:protein phosphatase 2C domain-containing protein [Streptomyces sp. NRRL WC-3742]
MLVSVASAPNPGRINEDFAVVSPETVVLLDGAGLPSGMDTGCIHGVPWFVRTLGTNISKHAIERPAALTECLADAIESTAQLHAGTCDLGNPMTPTSTVAIARARGGTFEWLVLADSTIVIRSDGLDAISDHRVSEVTSRQRAEMATDLEHLEERKRRIALAFAQRQLMNTDGGYWVAATDPSAAVWSLTGETPLPTVRAAAVLSDGAARAVDDFAVMGWPEFMSRLEADGPYNVIDHTRELERSDPQRRCWPRTKCHDDATAVLMQRELEGPIGRR